MLSRQTPVTTLSDPESPTGASADRRASNRTRWWPLKGHQRLLGLDIGSSFIKAVLLQRRQGRIRVKQVGLAPTPAAAVTNGIVTDGVAVAELLRSLCSDYRIRARKVAVAVGGEKVFCQAEILGDEPDQPLAAVVEQAAQAVVPYSLQRAALDYQEIPGPSPSPRRSLLWVSSAAEQVDWLRQTVTLAGRKPAIVDVEACALVNALTYNYPPESEDISVLLHIGARHMTVALVAGSTLLFSRNAVIGSKLQSADTLPTRVLAELDRHWDSLLERAQPRQLQRIYLSGGVARHPGVGQMLHGRSGLRVHELDPFRRISFDPSNEAGLIVREHGPSLSVAVGLALRSFDDL